MTTKQREARDVARVPAIVHSLRGNGIVYIEDVAEELGATYSTTWIALERAGFKIVPEGYAYRVL